MMESSGELYSVEVRVTDNYINKQDQINLIRYIQMRRNMGDLQSVLLV